jgi:uncharacterized membrane protein
MKNIGIIGILIVALTAMSGCGGGSGKQTTTVTTTTVGQQLTDLKTAFDAGAISEEEYEKQREAILKKG